MEEPKRGYCVRGEEKDKEHLLLNLIKLKNHIIHVVFVYKNS